MITRFFDYLAEEISKLASIKTYPVRSSGHLKSVAQGIKQFKKNVRHLRSVNFSDLEPHFP